MAIHLLSCSTVNNILAWGIYTAAFGLLAFTGPIADAKPPNKGGGGTAVTNKLSGEAFGVYIDITTLLNIDIFLTETPHVVLPTSGGFVSDQLLTLQVPEILTSNTFSVMSTGSIGGQIASSQSSSTVEDLNILNGLISADLVVAMCSSYGNGTTAQSNAAGSTFANLRIAGISYGNLNPSPNTTIPLPTIGKVILNEQVVGGDGKKTSAITTNMLHVELNGLLGYGDIIVSSAHCDVDFQPTSTAVKGFMTGGGRLGQGGDISTFGFNAGFNKKGKQVIPSGQLQYNDHGENLNIHSTSINSFSKSSNSPCVIFQGSARVNQQDGYSFTVSQACDLGEPGVGKDSFSINVSGPSLNYSNSGVLTGGNLQLH